MDFRNTSPITKYQIKLAVFFNILFSSQLAHNSTIISRWNYGTWILFIIKKHFRIIVIEER